MCPSPYFYSAPMPHLTASPASQTTPLSPANSIIYTNTKCGFHFRLPESWKGYSIIHSQWSGRILDAQPEKIETGPLLSIRHPLWTEANPRQDIPIMIFTRAQWKYIEKDDMAVSAAPIGPSELGRNKKYVFALPARYNYALPTGYEEVEDILQQKPLLAF